VSTQQLKDAADFICGLPDKDSAKILAQLRSLEQDTTEALIIKKLKGKIMELKVNKYRVVFFKTASIIYVVDAFKKQSDKTPKRVIDRAEKIYKIITK
jgi:phage-related protein